jgi:CO/xanthine dehydrogenase FAD-binding subunit
VLTAVELLNRHPNPERREIAAAISGNLCRCTGYQKILDAVQAVDPHAEISPGIPEAVKPPALTPPPGAAGGGRSVFMPESLADLWPILSEYPETRVFSGGTDLLVWIRSRKIDPPALVCLERIAALQGIVETGDGVRIGACSSHATLMENPLVGSLFPILTRALQTLGSPHIRRMGTLGGNIMTASPAGDTLAPLYVLGARVELCSARDVRQMPLESFILGPGRTALNNGEILSAVFIPKPVGITHQHFEKVGLRTAMACAVCSLAAVIGVSASGKIETAALAWGSVGPTVMRVPKMETALIGKPLTRKTLEEVIPLVGEALSPIDDVRASGAYRRLVAGNLLLRLVEVTASSPNAFPDNSIRRAESE